MRVAGNLSLETEHIGERVVSVRAVGVAHDAEERGQVVRSWATAGIRRCLEDADSISVTVLHEGERRPEYGHRMKVGNGHQRSKERFGRDKIVALDGGDGVRQDLYPACSTSFFVVWPTDER